MLPFKRILFPVDFSERCCEAGPYVSAMAKHFNAQLTLLHVIDAPPLGSYGMDLAMAATIVYSETIQARRRDELATFSNAFVKSEHLDSPVKCVVAHGDIATTITDYARTNAMQLIMMPTHGYGPFRRFLLGSVTTKVLREAECPVWTSAHRETEQNPKTSDYRSVLCVLEMTTGSVSLIRSAAQIAKEFGAVLRLLYVMQTPEAMAEQSMHDVGVTRLLLDSAREEIRKLQREAGTTAALFLETGEVPSIVRSTALRYAADLVVVGRSRVHETPEGHEMVEDQGIHSSAIIRESPCPVLSIYSRKDAPLDVSAPHLTATAR